LRPVVAAGDCVEVRHERCMLKATQRKGVEQQDAEWGSATWPLLPTTPPSTESIASLRTGDAFHHAASTHPR
jgi:hypothetical protein